MAALKVRMTNHMMQPNKQATQGLPALKVHTTGRSKALKVRMTKRISGRANFKTHISKAA